MYRHGFAAALIAAWFSGYQRDRLDANTIQGQGRYFDNKSSQPAAVADKRQREVKVGSKSYEARAKKFDTKVPGATPFQDKLKEYGNAKSRSWSRGGGCFKCGRPKGGKIGSKMRSKKELAWPTPGRPGQPNKPPYW